MTRALPAVVRAGSALLGAMWLLGAATIVLHAEQEHDFAAMALRTGGAAPKAALALWAALEALFGTAMLAGAVRGFVPTLAGLAGATGALVSFRAQFGGHRPCGCMAILADATVDESIGRNAAAFAATVALLAAARVSDRRSAADASPGAAEASGRATPAP